MGTERLTNGILPTEAVGKESYLEPVDKIVYAQSSWEGLVDNLGPAEAKKIKKIGKKKKNREKKSSRFMVSYAKLSVQNAAPHMPLSSFVLPCPVASA